MKTVVLLVTCILIIFNTLELVVTDSSLTADICTLCLCDTGIDPILINCEKQHLTKLFTEEEWNYTIEKNKINLTTAIFDVRFDENDFERITKFPVLPIVSLSFRGNPLNAIEPYAFAELNALVTLDLSHNNFVAKNLPEEVFKGKFGGTTYYLPLSIQSLNLSNNNIHIIENNLFDHFPNLTSLDLSYNPIRILGGPTSTAIADLNSLEYLNLAYTGISDIPPGMIHALLNLTTLDLTGNEFTTIPNELQNAHNLNYLTLDENLFEFFDEDSFRGLDSLTELSISNMKSLRLIEGKTFGGMKKLLKFYCHHNQNLDRISNAAFYEIAVNPEHWPIKEMYLNDNALTHIDKALAAWEVTPYIDIQNNPFRCNCDLKWMSGDLVDQIRRTHPHLVQNIVCSEPKDLKGASIIELGLEPETFERCEEGDFELSELRMLLNRASADDVQQSTAVTVLIVGTIFLVIGLAIVGVSFLRRNFRMASKVVGTTIRYQRADDDEDIEHECKTSASPYRA